MTLHATEQHADPQWPRPARALSAHALQAALCTDGRPQAAAASGLWSLSDNPASDPVTRPA